MSTGNRKNGIYNFSKNSTDKINYLMSSQHNLPSIQLNQHHMHFIPVYQQKLNYASSCSQSVAMASQKSKHAPMEIYRPPNIRAEISNAASSKKLNVHAKEFNPVRFAPTTPPNFLLRETATKQNSSHNIKSSGYKQNPNPNTITGHFNLQRAKSSGSMILDPSTAVSSQRVQFKTSFVTDKNNSKLDRKITPAELSLRAGILKRSKSLTTADALKFMEMEASFSTRSVLFSEYHLFPEESHAVMKQAVQDVNQLTDKQKMTLARYVIEHVLRDKKFSHPVAKLSIIIMEKDKNDTYLDSLLNTCQMFYQKKESCLWNNPNKFIMFVTFLTEMYKELKQSKSQLKFQSDPVTSPQQVLLLLISRCCEDILARDNTHSLSEIECLYSGLTSVGTDLEAELPQRMEILYKQIKETFLKSLDGPEIKKIMLQLIELKAANWQLPVSALNFYYPMTFQ